MSLPSLPLGSARPHGASSPAVRRPIWPAPAVAAAAAWIVTTLSAAPAAACEVCFGAARNSGSPLVTGARLGVFLLLGITVLVLGGFVAFFLYLRKRAQRFEHAELESIDSEWAQLQRSASS